MEEREDEGKGPNAVILKTKEPTGSLMASTSMRKGHVSTILGTTNQLEAPQEDQRKRPNAEREARETEEGTRNVRRVTNPQHGGMRDRSGTNVPNTMVKQPVDYNWRADMASRERQTWEEHEEMDLEDIPELIPEDSDSDSDSDTDSDTDITTVAETDSESEDGGGDEDMDDIPELSDVQEEPLGSQELGVFRDTAMQWVHNMFPNTEGERDVAERIDGVLQDAYKWGDYDYGLEQAIEWVLKEEDDPDMSMGSIIGDKYIPHEQVIKDCVEFLDFHGGLAAGSRARMKELGGNRLSRERVETTLSPENPDWQRLYDLAHPEGGMEVFTPEEFVPNWTAGLEGDPRSNLSKRGESPVARMVLENFVKPGLAFIVPEAWARENVPDTHEVPSTWAKKHNKKKGRNCMNSSWQRGPYQSLNSKWLRERTREEWGTIEHPTIADIALMAQEAIEEAEEDTDEDPDNLIAFKMDLEGAFLQLTFRASQVELQCTRITPQHMVYFVCGTFGWGGTPMAFQIITRIIVWELRHNKKWDFRGRVLMYVDDLMGICYKKDSEHNKRVIKELCEQLLGKGCISEGKTETGRRINVIGYTLDLDQRRIGVARHNLLKALYVATRVNIEEPVDVHTMETMAAHASRYKAVCAPLTPFARALHRSYKGVPRHHKVQLGVAAKRSVWLLRILLIFMELRQTEYTKKIIAFKIKGTKPDFAVGFDGSLSGLGLIWFQLTQGDYVAVGCCGIDITWMGLTKSDYQNLVEFLAFLISIRELIRRGCKGKSIQLWGDSMSALAWARKESFKSDNCGFALMVYVLEKWLSELEIYDTIHIGHGDTYDENWRCDWLSRHRTREEVLAEDLRDPRGSQLTEAMETWVVDETELLTLCHPVWNVLDTEEQFGTWWGKLLALLTTNQTIIPDEPQVGGR